MFVYRGQIFEAGGEIKFSPVYSHIVLLLKSKAIGFGDDHVSGLADVVEDTLCGVRVAERRVGLELLHDGVALVDDDDGLPSGVGCQSVEDDAPERLGLDSSIYMWAYGVEICFSPSASKNFYSVLPHMTSKGRGQGFNGSIYLEGYGAWFQWLNIFVRVRGMVSTAQNICKGGY